jgi:DNA-binding NarL/FixJ family response regulator
MFSPQFYEELRKLKEKGLSDETICKRLGISNKTVSNVLSKWCSVK